MFLISSEGKNKEQITQESLEALQKYRKVESQVRFKMTLASIYGKIKVVLLNNILTRQIKNLIPGRKSFGESLAEEAFQNLRRNVEAQRKADLIAERVGSNLRRNLEAEKNDPNYQPPI